MLWPVRIEGIFGAIGTFAVKFRWAVVLVWLVATFAVSAFLPSLASVTQGNNANFLPASAPSEHAVNLAKPFGATNLVPIPVVAAASQGQLTTSDRAWLNTLRQDLRTVPTVVRVTDLGTSRDGQAEQLQVLSDVGQGDQAGITGLVDHLRTAIARAGPPAGGQAHLAGAIASRWTSRRRAAPPVTRKRA
jgi:putative drug exporter of the RND superfamily